MGHHARPVAGRTTSGIDRRIVRRVDGRGAVGGIGSSVASRIARHLVTDVATPLERSIEADRPVTGSRTVGGVDALGWTVRRTDLGRRIARSS
jgi:hypothetical protein